MKPVRVLIVDDSRLDARADPRHADARPEAISVVGEAADPLEAREAIKALNPDVDDARRRDAEHERPRVSWRR